MIAAVLASEWTKIRSVRSTYYTFGSLAAVIMLAAFLMWRGLQRWEQLSPGQPALQPLRMEHIVLPFMYLCVGAFGVQSLTVEYATGTIRTSLLAVPRRLLLLGGKAGVVAFVALVVGLLAAIATHLLSAIIIGDRAELMDHALQTPGQARALLGLGLSAMTIALVGLGFGAVLRSAAGALIAIAVVLFMPPIVAGYLPRPWNIWLSSAALSNLPLQLVDAAANAAVLRPVGALGAMLAYVTVALAAAGATIVRSDV